VLDDGNYANGVQFLSKYGTGKCWAYWLTRRDLGLSNELVSVVAEQEVLAADSDLKAVLALYGAKCR
ncbi:hypothetical protein AB4Y80_15980, partial [Specibacter sp. RAF43]